MLQILNYFFVSLGVIFFVLLVGALLIWWSDAWGVRTITEFVLLPQTELTTTAPAMSVEQEAALQDAGVDPSVFANITLQQQNCFAERLGEERVSEIMAGAMPSPAEVGASASCLQD